MSLGVCFQKHNRVYIRALDWARVIVMARDSLKFWEGMQFMIN